MNPEYLNSIVTLVVGGIAFLVYWLTKRTEKRNAAIIVLMDIRHAEQVVLSILEKGTIDILVKNIIVENNWGKYKHLFATHFSQDDFSAFNEFFGGCVEISEARVRMLEIFDTNLRAKAETAQQMLLALDRSVPATYQVERQEIIDNANAETWTFGPGDPTERILKSLKRMGRLSNTIAFEKLKAITGIKA